MNKTYGLIFLTNIFKYDIICTIYGDKLGGFMKIIVSNRLLEFSDEELDSMYIDRGQEGSVYHFEDEAYKIYHTMCLKTRLDEESCLKLKEIPTTNVLMPKELIYNTSNQFIGYSTSFIVPESYVKIWRLKVKEFIHKIDRVYDDLRILSERHVSVADLNLDNFIYHDGFYFIDPGSYAIEPEIVSTSKVLLDNWEEFRRFIVDELFTSYMNSKKKDKIIYKFLGEEYLPDMLVGDYYESETVKQYLKRITS